MSDKIYYLMQAVVNVLDGGWIFVITSIMQVALFVSVLLLTLLKPLYTLKRRVWFFISNLSELALELAFLSFASQVELFYLSLSLVLILFCVVILLPVKNLKISQSQRELARLIDDSVKDCEQEKENPLQTQVEEKPINYGVNSNYDDASRFELDFQHVKLVMQKLEYYPLSASDKKIMKELEENIFLAENQGFSTIIKNKINDGLGALLKIMSKYGV